jgi:hypothetical protein
MLSLARLDGARWEVAIDRVKMFGLCGNLDVFRRLSILHFYSFSSNGTHVNWPAYLYRRAVLQDRGFLMYHRETFADTIFLAELWPRQTRASTERRSSVCSKTRTSILGTHLSSRDRLARAWSWFFFVNLSGVFDRLARARGRLFSST